MGFHRAARDKQDEVPSQSSGAQVDCADGCCHIQCLFRELLVDTIFPFLLCLLCTCSPCDWVLGIQLELRTPLVTVACCVFGASLRTNHPWGIAEFEPVIPVKWAECP